MVNLDRTFRPDAASYADPSGRVFHWNDRVFRGIAPDQTEHARRVMASPAVRRLQERRMVIDAEPARDTPSPFELLIEHRRILFPSYCFEWTPQMLADAATLTLEIATEISDEELALQDAYPWNIFFEGTRPIFIDFGSFVPARADALWAPYDQFCSFFLFPLYLYSVGLYDAARRFLVDYLTGLTAERFLQLAPLALKVRHPLRYARHASTFHTARLIRRLRLEEPLRDFIRTSYAHGSRTVAPARKRMLKLLAREVASIRLPAPQSHWSGYYDDLGSYTEAESARKQALVAEVLSRHAPATVLDAGCNTGLYSFLAAERGTRVIAVDNDASSVARLHRHASERGADILPLVLDVLNPSPSFGWCARQFPSAVERFRVDMVMAFAVIHHLAITGRQGFARALEALEAFSTRHILVEFVDADDPMVVRLRSQSAQDYSWYTFEGFTAAVHRRAKNVALLTPHSPTRRFVLYEKL